MSSNRERIIIPAAPLSPNHAYGYNAYRGSSVSMFLREVGKAYKDLVKRSAQEQLNGRLSDLETIKLDITVLYPKDQFFASGSKLQKEWDDVYRRRDVSHVKLLEDALCEYLGIDDTRVQSLTVRKLVVEELPVQPVIYSVDDPIPIGNTIVYIYKQDVNESIEELPKEDRDMFILPTSHNIENNETDELPHWYAEEYRTKADLLQALPSTDDLAAVHALCARLRSRAVQDWAALYDTDITTAVQRISRAQSDLSRRYSSKIPDKDTYYIWTLYWELRESKPSFIAELHALIPFLNEFNDTPVLIVNPLAGGILSLYPNISWTIVATPEQRKYITHREPSLDTAKWITITHWEEVSAVLREHGGLYPAVICYDAIELVSDPKELLDCLVARLQDGGLLALRYTCKAKEWGRARKWVKTHSRPEIQRYLTRKSSLGMTTADSRGFRDTIKLLTKPMKD